MKECCSIFIVNSEKERWSSLQLKYLLEIAGYIVLEVPADFCVEKDRRYQRIIIGSGEDNDALFFDWEKDKVVDFVNKVIGVDFYKEKKKGKVFSEGKLWIKKDILVSLYTITCGYANRRTLYKDVELLMKATENLIDECKALENILETNNSRISWRVYYAYLYLLNYVNEATIKLRTYNHRSLDEVRKYYKKLKELRPDCESVELLWANLVRNDNIMSGQSLICYEKLLDSNEVGIQYLSNWCVGEIKQECAEKSWKIDRERGIKKDKSSYFEEAIKFYKKCKEINKEDIRILYRFALQSERRSYTNENESREAKKFYEHIINIILNKNICARTSLEFEYLYKSYIYCGRLNKILKLNDEALECFRKAEKCWNELENYKLLQEIYTLEDIRVFERIIDKKYECRYITLDSNIRKLKEIMQTG